MIFRKNLILQSKKEVSTNIYCYLDGQYEDSFLFSACSNEPEYEYCTTWIKDKFELLTDIFE